MKLAKNPSVRSLVKRELLASICYSVDKGGKIRKTNLFEFFGNVSEWPGPFGVTPVDGIVKYKHNCYKMTDHGRVYGDFLTKSETVEKLFNLWYDQIIDLSPEAIFFDETDALEFATP